MTRLLYLDTSATIKLFLAEAETAALKAWLSTQGSATVVTADLARTEIRRALHAHASPPQVSDEAAEWLDRCAVVRMPPQVFDRAGRLAPGDRLRSLDALHCSAALSLGAAVTAFVAYDKRLLEAAGGLGLPVHSPV